jgi:long-chain fatty acid transport protein
MWGASIDFVWAGMDLVVDLKGDGIKDITFKDDSDFSGAAKACSVAAKLGFTFRLSDAVTSIRLRPTCLNWKRAVTR